MKVVTITYPCAKGRSYRFEGLSDEVTRAFFDYLEAKNISFALIPHKGHNIVDIDIELISFDGNYKETFNISGKELVGDFLRYYTELKGGI